MRIRNRQKMAWTKSHQRDEAILSILRYLENTSRSREERREKVSTGKLGTADRKRFGRIRQVCADNSRDERSQAHCFVIYKRTHSDITFNRLHTNKEIPDSGQSGPFLDYWRIRPMTSPPVTSDWPCFRSFRFFFLSFSALLRFTPITMLDYSYILIYIS